MRLSACVVLFALLAGGQALPRKISLSVQDERIIGGDETTIDSFPYQVALSYFDSFKCGGSILNENFILTAAHCLNEVRFDWHVTARAGSTNREYGGQLVKASKTMADPRFTMTKLNFDVGLIKLEKPLVLSAVVRPVQLVDVGLQPETSSRITLSGWGVTQDGGRNAPKMLRTTNVSVVSHWRCSLSYTLVSKITDAMFCASASGKDSCQGDSGGPAVNDEGKQTGIVSFGNGCAGWFYPGVYTNLANSEVRQFIDQAQTQMS